MTKPRDYEGRLGWVSAARVAALLGISRRTVITWCEKGIIPAKQHNERAQWRIDSEWFVAEAARLHRRKEAAEILSAAIQPIRRSK